MKKLVKWIYSVCVVCVLFCLGVLLADILVLQNGMDQYDSIVEEINIKVILSVVERSLTNARLFIQEQLGEIKSLILDKGAFFGTESMIK